MNINQVAMGCKPDPNNFKIVHLEHLNGKTIVIANYGGSTFNGDKLMVLHGTYDNFTTLDPHFLNEEYPVFARFQPTQDGLALARLACTRLDPFREIYNLFMRKTSNRRVYKKWEEELVKICKKYMQKEVSQ